MLKKTLTQCKNCNHDNACAIHEESCNGYIADCPDYEISENICVYCGEDKRFNRLKHILEIAKFLEEQIIECQKILKDVMDK